MLQLTFTPEQVQTIKHQRFHHPHPRVRLKMEVLWLKSKGLSHAQIQDLAEVSVNTMLGYFREFLEGGIERVMETRFYQPASELDPYAPTIQEAFEKNPPADVHEAQDRIEQLTGIRRCPTQIRKFLHRIGAKYRKVGVIPAKADPEKQAEFKKKR